MTIESAFLKDLASWRETLARDLVVRDPALNERELNRAVEQIIGGVVFRGVCAERGIEPYEVGCPAGLWPPLKVDDEILKGVAERLNAPDCPYRFSDLPADILGRAYERFLEKRLHLTADRRVLIGEGTTARKAHGVYYTPAHVVDYIVQHAVGELLDRATPMVMAGTPRVVARRIPGRPLRLRVIDPACGSGTFLISAYQYLLDWYRSQYPADGAENHLRELCQSRDDRPLAFDERRSILLDHIYGVDMDAGAVALTKLSLLLKLLEGQTRETLQALPRDFLELTMQQFGSNIKSGNSLVGPSREFALDGSVRGRTSRPYHEGNLQLGFFDDQEDQEVRPFDWPAEFPTVFTGPRRGFDAVIGNPPYIFGEYHHRRLKQYLESTYELAKDQYDAYWLFIERGLALTARGGRCAMIVPDALLARDEAARVRRMLLDNGLARVYHAGLAFQAGVSTMVFSVAKGARPGWVISEVRDDTVGAVRPAAGGSVQHEPLPLVEHTCSRRRFRSDPRLRLTVHASDEEAHLLARLRSKRLPLGSMIAMSRGEETGKRHVFDEGPVPILAGEDVSRYRISSPTRFVRQMTKNTAHYQSPKIVVVKTGRRCVAALDRTGIVTMQSLYNVHVTRPDIRAETILGILNSNLIRFYVEKTFTAYKLLFPQLNQTTLLSIPIPRDIGRRQKPLTETVCQMLDLREQSASPKTGQESEETQRQIDEIDRQIDRLVYDLYRLKEEEVAVVERSRRAGPK